MKGRFAHCDFCNKYFENKDDLDGHRITVHEGWRSAAASDSDFNVNEGSAREDGELSMKNDSTEDLVLIRWRFYYEKNKQFCFEIH